MKLLKRAGIATTVALSLGFFSTTTTAEVCLGMACMYNRMTPSEGITATVTQINQALKAINDNASQVVIIDNIKDALKVSKEINANDKVDSNRQRANGYLKKARTAVRKEDLVQATEDLKEAETRFLALKGMLNLTQSDRTAQQTHMLDR